VAITQPEIIVYSHIALYNFVVVVQTLRKLCCCCTDFKKEIYAKLADKKLMF